MPLRPTLGILLLLISTGISLFADTTSETPEPFASLPRHLQPRASEFPLVPSDTDGETAHITTLTLNQKPEVFDSGHAFDAIRIRSPKQPGLDLIWAFSTPTAWRHWYILPATGAPKPGFKNWFNGDRAYAGLDGDIANPVTLQSLDAAYFEPDREYLIWFCQTRHTPDPAPLKLTLRFSPPPKDNQPWNLKTIEEALKLKTAPAAAQSDYFKSRGARILCDTDLFHPEDAASQMDHFLYTRRQTEFMKDGLYITIETSCPPCHGSPKLADIIRKHGAPDCVLTTAQYNATRTEDSGEPTEYDRHYYDYFVFETDPADREQHIRRVSSQYFDTTKARPAKAPDLTWADVTLVGTDFRLFYDHGREIARYIRWQTPEAKRISGETIPAAYQRTYDDGEPMEKLTYAHDGNWTYESYYRSGPVYRRCAYLDGKLEGGLTDYFENGGKRVQATYRQGKLHGRLQVWSEDSRVERDQYFVDGKPKKNAPCTGKPGRLKRSDRAAPLPTSVPINPIRPIHPICPIHPTDLTPARPRFSTPPMPRRHQPACCSLEHDLSPSG